MERGGLLWLASGCVILGLLPAQIVPVLARVAEQLHVGRLLPNGAPWWMLVPLQGRQASYAPLVFSCAVVAVVLLTIWVVRLLYHQRIRRVAPWDCGFGRLDARMQDTAEGFGQPIRHLFEPFFAMQRQLPSPFDPAPRYRVVIGDRIWNAAYAPLGALVQRIADAFAALQQDVYKRQGPGARARQRIDLPGLAAVHGRLRPGIRGRRHRRVPGAGVQARPWTGGVAADAAVHVSGLNAAGLMAGVSAPLRAVRPV